MQTLSAMADLITKKVGQIDAYSIALCKTYLDARYKTIFDSYYWTDAQMTGTASLTAGNNTFTYPTAMERIVTIRSAGNKFLDPIASEFLIETDPTMFERSGIPLYYEEVTDGTTGVNSVIVYPKPTVTTAFLIVGKRLCPGLSADGDKSILRNCDQAIMAYATGDMLERARQAGKAQAKF